MTQALVENTVEELKHVRQSVEDARRHTGAAQSADVYNTRRDEL